jgi:hypothetical protein
MAKDAFDVVATAATHVIENDKGSLSDELRKVLNHPEMTHGACLTALQAIDDLDDVADGMHLPFEERKTYKDWLQHYSLPTTDEAEHTAKQIASRLQSEYVTSEVAARLGHRDKVNHPEKHSLPAIKREANDNSVRAALLKSIKDEGY